MNRFFTLCLLFVAAVLAGCASHPGPESRPYTAEETRELALEALSRRGLSFDEYQQKKAELLGAPQKVFGFDSPGEMSAGSGFIHPGHPS